VQLGILGIVSASIFRWTVCKEIPALFSSALLSYLEHENRTHFPKVEVFYIELGQCTSPKEHP
jgi:hypothetical protein